jgi:cell division protein FtsI (penicillin-binding protein 3)
MILEKKLLDDSGLGVNFTKIRFRIKVIIFFMILVGLIYSGRLLYSGLLLNAHKIVILENKNLKVLPFRKNIVDRNGNILATSLPVHSIGINPRKVLNKKEITNKLSKIFPDLEYTKLDKQLNSDKQFVWIKRNLTPKT